VPQNPQKYANSRWKSEKFSGEGVCPLLRPLTGVFISHHPLDASLASARAYTGLAFDPHFQIASAAPGLTRSIYYVHPLHTITASKT